MKNLLKYRQNKWSEFGKGFIVKMRKNTGFLQVFKHFLIRKYAQEFSNLYILNLVKTSKIQNTRKADMNTIKGVNTKGCGIG